MMIGIITGTFTGILTGIIIIIAFPWPSSSIAVPVCMVGEQS
jgi:hypothetical protein